MKYIIPAIVVVFLITMIGFPLIVGSFVPYKIIPYSNGQRTGLLNKISKKGLICKTYEGYMLVGNGQNVNPETFEFTVKDEALAHQLEENTGKIVTLDYQQFFNTSGCWGDTDYEIKGVK